MLNFDQLSSIADSLELRCIYEEFDEGEEVKKIAEYIYFRNPRQGWLKLSIVDNNDDQELILVQAGITEIPDYSASVIAQTGPFNETSLIITINKRGAITEYGENLVLKSRDWKVIIQSGVIASVLFAIDVQCRE